MNCMKCGKEIPDGQVFCQECLDGMAQHPVAHDAHVQIPRRPSKAPEKKIKEVPLPEQVSRLKKVIRWMAATIGVLFIIICVFAILLLHQAKNDEGKTPLGRNYTTSPKLQD